MPADILNEGPNGVDFDALEEALQDLQEALRGSTGIFFLGEDGEWCVNVGRTEDMEISEIH